MDAPPPPTRPLRLGVVIVTHNSRAALEGCLDKLMSEAVSAEVEYWVIDSGSEPEQRPLDANASEILCTYNYGYGTSVNIAVQSGLSADWIVVVNPDTQVTARDLVRAVTIAETESVHLCAPRLDNSPGGGHFTSLPTPPWRSREHLLGSGPAVDVLSLQGSVLAIGAEAFRRLGGFDERFFLYFEEIDLCRRARRAGLRVAFIDSVSAQHTGESSSSGVSSTWRRAERARGKAEYISLHFSKLEGIASRLVSILTSGRRMLPVARQLQTAPRKDLPWPPTIEIRIRNPGD